LDYRLGDGALVEGLGSALGRSAQGGSKLGVLEQIARRAGAAGPIEEVLARSRREVLRAVPAQQQVQTRRDAKAVRSEPDRRREEARPRQPAMPAVHSLEDRE